MSPYLHPQLCPSRLLISRDVGLGDDPVTNRGLPRWLTATPARCLANPLSLSFCFFSPLFHLSLSSSSSSSYHSLLCSPSHPGETRSILTLGLWASGGQSWRKHAECLSPEKGLWDEGVGSSAAAGVLVGLWVLGVRGLGTG